MSAFTIKRGDTSPLLRYELAPASVNIAGATVQFQMRARFGELKVDAEAIVESTDPPVLRYKWVTGDTDTAGKFDGEFKVTYADGAIETFPNSGFIPIIVNEDI